MKNLASLLLCGVLSLPLACSKPATKSVQTTQTEPLNEIFNLLNNSEPIYLTPENFQANSELFSPRKNRIVYYSLSSSYSTGYIGKSTISIQNYENITDIEIFSKDTNFRFKARYSNGKVIQSSIISNQSGVRVEYSKEKIKKILEEIHKQTGDKRTDIERLIDGLI